MPVLFLIITGAAVGFVATRLLKLDTDLLTTILLGIGGALIGGLVLRFLLMLTGLGAGFVGALIGAMVLVLAYKAIWGGRS